MLKNLYIISEGRTECNFIKYVLYEYLINFNWNTIPLNNNGWSRSHPYRNAIQKIEKFILTHKHDVHTTFFDLYGFPKDIPCYEQAKALTSPYDKARLYEQQIKQDISELFRDDPSYNENLFIPYIQPYEFESFLFIDPRCSAHNLVSEDETKAELLEFEIRKISSGFDTPEHINDSPEKAPSKRIAKLVPGFVKNKAGKAGFSWRIAQNVGIQNIRHTCRYFNEWVSLIELYK